MVLYIGPWQEYRLGKLVEESVKAAQRETNPDDLHETIRSFAREQLQARRSSARLSNQFTRNRKSKEEDQKICMTRKSQNDLNKQTPLSLSKERNNIKKTLSVNYCNRRAKPKDHAILNGKARSSRNSKSENVANLGHDFQDASIFSEGKLATSIKSRPAKCANSMGRRHLKMNQHQTRAERMRRSWMQDEIKGNLEFQKNKLSEVKTETNVEYLKTQDTTFSITKSLSKPEERVFQLLGEDANGNTSVAFDDNKIRHRNSIIATDHHLNSDDDSYIGNREVPESLDDLLDWAASLPI